MLARGKGDTRRWWNLSERLLDAGLAPPFIPILLFYFSFLSKVQISFMFFFHVMECSFQDKELFCIYLLVFILFPIIIDYEATTSPWARIVPAKEGNEEKEKQIKITK